MATIIILVKPLAVATIGVIRKLLDGVGVDVVAENRPTYPSILSSLIDTPAL
jgi:hypothetical protein